MEGGHIQGVVLCSRGLPSGERSISVRRDAAIQVDFCVIQDPREQRPGLHLWDAVGAVYRRCQRRPQALGGSDWKWKATMGGWFAERGRLQRRYIDRHDVVVLRGVNADHLRAANWALLTLPQHDGPVIV